MVRKLKKKSELEKVAVLDTKLSRRLAGASLSERKEIRAQLKQKVKKIRTPVSQIKNREIPTSSTLSARRNAATLQNRARRRRFNMLQGQKNVVQRIVEFLKKDLRPTGKRAAL